MYTSKKETVLLYNIKGGPFAPKLKMLLLKMGIRIRIVNDDEYTMKIADLLSIPANDEAQPPAVEASTCIKEEMIVLYNFTEQRLNLFLSELRRNGVLIPLKAIVTPHNCNWNSYELHAELMQEHLSFQKINQDISKTE